MKKLRIIFLVGLLIISGCKRKKVVQERLCSRVDLEQITSLLPKTSDDVYLFAQQTIDLLNQAFVKIDEIPAEQRSYSNTLLIYEQAYFQFFTQQHILQILARLSQDSGIQTAANVALLELDEYAQNMLKRNVTLYQAFEEYEKHGKDPYRHIKPVTFFLESSFEQFERQGMQLSVQNRQELEQVEKEINNLAGRFCSNVLHDQRYLIVGADQVAGMPEEFIQTLSKDDQGNYIFTIDAKTFSLVMKHCHNVQMRRDYYIMYHQRGYPHNELILQNLQQKRQEYANLLGFHDYAAYQLDNAMIKTAKKADSFLWNMIKDIQEYDDAQFAAMIRHLPPSVQLNTNKKLQPWDQEFVKTWYQKNHFKIDDGEVANYFPLDHVLPTMLKQLSRFFHVEFELQDPTNLWASNVICYRVRSMKHQAVLGYLFFDLYAREAKRDDGMYQLTMIPAIRDDCSIPCVGASVVVANFASSFEGSKVQGQAVTLSFADVKSLLYQMGYALHAVFGATRFTKFSGTQVVYDFDKVPSEVLQQWILQPEFLHELSHHEKTGVCLNRATIEQLIAREKFGKADLVLQQLFLGLIALALCEQQHQNVHGMIEKLHKKIFRHLAYVPENYFEMSFLPFADNEHVSLYYCNVFSEVIAADIFAEIKKHGIFNHEIGMRYVTEILSPGGSRNAYEMIKRFLGHPFHRKTFLEAL